MGNVFTNNSSISNGIWTSMGSNNIMNDEELREQIYDKLKSDKRADTYVIPTRVMDTIVEFIQTEMAEAERRAKQEVVKQLLTTDPRWTHDAAKDILEQLTEIEV